MHHDFTPDQLLYNRRDFLAKSGMGFGAVAASSMLAEGTTNPLAVRKPHFPARAKAVIHLFMNGGPSQVDTFDPKPELAKHDGKKIPVDLRTERPTGAAMKSPFAFSKHGQSGLEISELFPHVAKSADELCVIRSMHANVPNHEPSLLLMNCGESRLVRPSVGSWVSYGLGTENQNLPGFISMCPGGYPIQESQNWQSGFLPGAYQGTYIDTKHKAIDKLIANIENKDLGLGEQRRQLDLLQRINRRHLQQRGDDQQLESRLQSYELAYRMQMDATDAFDIEREPQHVRELYGDGVHGRQTLVARRLVERGVRYVQLWHGNGQPWDSHDDLEQEPPPARQASATRRSAGCLTRPQAARHAGGDAGDLGRRVRPHSGGRDAQAR